MTDAEAVAQLTEGDILAATMWAEARGDGREGNSSVEERIAVGVVARNRVAHPAWWGKSFRDVCLKHAQFSCWLDDPTENHLALMSLIRAIVNGQAIADDLFIETRLLADGIRRGILLDRTGGSDFYYAPLAMKPAGSAPSWAKLANGAIKPPTAIIGNQHFYKIGPS